MNVESVDSNNTYIIEVGAEPKCSCKDWLNTHLPCKHLLGMFIVVEGCSWDDMPKSYTSCPHFNLDPHLKQQAMASVKQSTCTNHLENLSQCNLERVVDPVEKMEVETIINEPNDCRAIAPGNELKKSLAVLKDIQNSLFLIRNHTDLSDIYTQLQAVQSNINNKIPCEAGLPTLTTTKPTKRARKFINLPPRKKFIPTKKATEKQINIPKDVIVEGTFDLPIDLCREEDVESPLENLESSPLTDSERDHRCLYIFVDSNQTESLISGEDLIFNDEQGFLQDVRYGIAKQLLEVSDSLEGTCRACQNTATLTGFVNWVKCVTCEKSFHAVCVYTSSNLGSENSVFQCYICVRLKKKQPSVTNSNPKEHVVPKRKMRRPRLKKIQTNEDTMQLNSTAINSNHNAHWLFQGTNAQTTITQTLISGMCGYTLDDIDLLIKGSSSVGEETVAEMFETYVEAGLKEVMEIRNGCTE
ncbi:unnamed protein product [Mytilus coruscus]|uniref:SWIM-type domain-containing protein n=1 Tax=Mytilus coruscus TaxID=42192 RepID=A0A6J8A7D0_MYTCO|nr:unnamed protein product [Mytilus coruscus]